MTYQFLSNGGNFVTVEAKDELEARKLAMYKLHGQPNRPYFPTVWTGYGLHLRSVEQ